MTSVLISWPATYIKGATESVAGRDSLPGSYIGISNQSRVPIVGWVVKNLVTVTRSGAHDFSTLTSGRDYPPGFSREQTQTCYR
eukprot:SAG31_NODE_7457_length_1684_cov_2.406309_2_plen_84_part_00